MVIDTLDNCRSYESLHPHFKAAFDFLHRADIEALPPGRIEIDGTALFAMIQGYETKPVQEGKLEAHRKYIDIQFVLKGAEAIGYAPLNGQSAAKVFDPEKDIGFYNGTFCLPILCKGMFAIFFPQDAHLPGRFVDKPRFVKKIVVKIAVSP
jgi:biofilm protein TabA